MYDVRIYIHIYLCAYMSESIATLLCAPPAYTFARVCQPVSVLCVPVSVCVCLSLLYKSAQQKLSSFPKETYQFRSTHVSMPENEKKQGSSSNLPLPVSPLQKQGPPPPQKP